MKLGNQTYLEIKHNADKDYILFIPTGCTEQQGPHLTVDFDTWFAEELLEAVSENAIKKHGIYSMVAPVLPFGTTPEHVNYGAGYVNLPQSVFEDILYHTLKSFAKQGFKRLVLWRGCGGHQVQSVMQRFNDDFKGQSEVVTFHHPFYNVWCKFMSPNIPGGHADSFTTAITMYRHPEKVRTHLIKDPESLEPYWEDENLDFTQYSKTGVIGDPTHASAKLGEKLWKETIKEVTEMLVDFNKE